MACFFSARWNEVCGVIEIRSDSQDEVEDEDENNSCMHNNPGKIKQNTPDTPNFFMHTFCDWKYGTWKNITN